MNILGIKTKNAQSILRNKLFMELIMHIMSNPLSIPSKTILPFTSAGALQKIFDPIFRVNARTRKSAILQILVIEQIKSHHLAPPRLKKSKQNKWGMPNFQSTENPNCRERNPAEENTFPFPEIGIVLLYLSGTQSQSTQLGWELKIFENQGKCQTNIFSQSYITHFWCYKINN